jgi:hypothetical protein
VAQIRRYDCVSALDAALKNCITSLSMRAWIYRIYRDAIQLAPDF